VNTASLLWCIVFGSVGLGYFLYGRKQKALVPFLCGIALMAFPYFVSGTVPLALIGIALAALPWFVRI
jgi:hypothetical protein